MSSGASPISQATGIAAQFGLDLTQNQSQPEWVYPEILKSRTLARSMLKRKFDTKKFGQQKTLLYLLTYDGKMSKVDTNKNIQSAITSVINMIEIGKKDSHYDLTVSAFEPYFAKDFAVAVIEELDSHQREYNKSKTSETRQFIQERIIDTEKELKEAEETLKNFRDRNRRIENSPALLLEQQRLLREVSVLTGVFTTLKQQLETTKIEEVIENSNVIIVCYDI